MPNTWCSTPIVTIASATITAMAAPGLRCAAAISIVSSLAKSADVGRPNRPSSASRNASEVRGDVRQRPWMFAIFVVCVRSRISPAVKNRLLFASVWPTMCITAAAAPAGPIARPTDISPMCSTLE